MKTLPVKGFTGRIDPQYNAKVIADYAYTARRAWESACKHDGIPPDSRFVCFSYDNPFVRFHDLAMKQLREAQAQAAVGGYIGLRAGNSDTRKAVQA